MSIEINDPKELSIYLNKTHGEISKICYPLFKNTPIDYFDHEFFYESGKMVNFSTSPDIGTKYYSEWLNPTFEEFRLLYDLGYKYTFLSPSMHLPPGASLANPEKYQHNIDLCVQNKVHHRIYLLKRKKNNFYIYGFGSSSQKRSMVDFFMNSLNVLERFVEYFEKKARDLIENSHETSTIFLPNYLLKLDRKILQEDIAVNLPIDFNKFLDKDDDTSCLLQFGEHLTPREIDCLDLLSQGFTMKVIARKLLISPRTVESYLRNVKEKCGVQTKSELIEFWQKTVNY